MARKLIPVFCLVAFLFLSAGPVFADAVVVEGDKIFIADDELSVLNIADGLTAGCSADLVTVSGDTISGATNVVVTDGTAVVTVGEAGSLSVEIVDVSACLEDIFDVDVDECVATIDLDNGVIDIPCLYYNGVVYDIDMEQRGGSDNWEVTFGSTNEDMSEYEHDDNDNGNDNDDNDNDDNDNDDNDNDNDNDDNDNDNDD